MKRFDPSELLELRRYLSIKHHVKGRLRVVFSPALLERVPRVEPGRVQGLLSDMPGVREVRFNLPARSAVVNYDPAQIPPRVLVDLIEGDDSEAAEALERLTPRSAASKRRTEKRGNT